MGKFLDHVVIEVRAGDGGNGVIAWRREKYEPLGGPAGGNGGRGGDVFIEADSGLNTLSAFRYQKKFEAANGEKGRSKDMHGKAGNDLVIKVPVGTQIIDAVTDQAVSDLNKNGMRILIAAGGRGGRGNAMFASAKERAPHFCEPGEAGIYRKLELTLKLFADVGIIGLPNAGKSSLLSVISAAKPKIADYPFSTLEPALGVVRLDGNSSFVAADIPGLIEGASQGVGLGHQFLRHIERTRLLFHVVDVAADKIESDILTINKELALYSDRLKELPQILVINKIDLFAADVVKKIAAGICKDKFQFVAVFTISCATGSGVKQLCNKAFDILAKMPKPEALETAGEDEKARDHGDRGFNISRHKDQFVIEGDRVNRLVAVTDLKDPLSLHHLYKIFMSMGIIDELIRQKIEPGNEIIVGRISFIFGEGFG